MIRFTGTIYTGLLDPPTTDALLVGDDGRIVATGENARRLGGKNVEETALGDRVVVPGFIDAHMHLESLATGLTQLDLAEPTSLDDMLERLAAHASTMPVDRTLVGTGWDESTWPEAVMPVCEVLDAVAPRHAVVLRRVDGHLWAVNSEALRRIARRTDLTDEQRRRLKDVSADGLLREADIGLARPLAQPTREELRDGLMQAMHHAARMGVTCIHDVGGVAETLVELDREALIPCRLVVAPRPEQVDDDAPETVLERFRGRRASPGPVKFFLDGSIGAQTAAVSEPFCDDPGNTGQLLWDERELESVVEHYHVAGLQVALHAIGDVGIGQALDVLERVLERHPRDDHRHRIEHAEIITPVQIERMASLGVIASMQPNFLRWHNPGGLYDRRLGTRTRDVNPFRSILDAGIPLAFGSDGMPFDPFFGVRCAMNHTASTERLGFVEALHAYTHVSAFAGRIEHLTGSLEPGRQADLVILSADPSRTDDVLVEQVYIDGKPSLPAGP